jgi:hypothetical protein
MIFLLVIPVSIAVFVFLITKTEFVLEYGRILGLSGLLLADEYKVWKEENQIMGYTVFLRERYDNFFGHLIGCPLCLCCFLNFIFAFCVFFLSFIILGLLFSAASLLLLMTLLSLYRYLEK